MKILSALILISVTSGAHAFNKCAAPDGTTTFTDKPCPGYARSAKADAPKAAATGDAHVEEELAQGHLKVMERFLQVLGGINDAAGAKQAQTELTNLSAQNKALFDKARSLNVSNDAMVKYVQAHYKARGEAIFNGIFASMSRMSALPEFEAMGKYISAPVNELSNATWASISHEEHLSPTSASPVVVTPLATRSEDSGCAAAKFKLEVVSASGGVYQTDANGNSTKESDEQVRREKEAAEQKVRELCR